MLLFILILRNIADCDIQSAFYFQNMFFITRNICLFTIVYVSAAYDVKRYIVPGGLIISGMILGTVNVVIQCFTFGLLSGLRYLISALLVCSILFFVAVICKGSLGGGDIKLVSVMCLFVGLRRTLICILLACVIGILIFGFAAIIKKTIRKIPFVPAIMLSIWYILCIDTDIMQLYNM